MCAVRLVRTKRARTFAEEDKVIDGDSGPGDGPAVRLGSPGGHEDLAEAQICARPRKHPRWIGTRHPADGQGVDEVRLDANLDKKANQMSLNLTVTARDHVLL
jgi:hypothetical protein